MNKKLLGLTVIMILLGMIGMAQATLTVIGTAAYDDGTGPQEYNLIWDDDNNGNSVVWLDYSNAIASWTIQTAWTAGLDAQLTYNIDPAYTVNWIDAAWRLPDTVDGLYDDTLCDGTTTGGYNITTSEMGHLFYTELGNLAFVDTSCNSAQPNWGLLNTGDFQNLSSFWYWSGTEYGVNPADAWSFMLHYGNQRNFDKANAWFGLAIRSGQVNDSNVPIPTLSEWGQILLVVILCVSAFYINRKRQLLT